MDSVTKLWYYHNWLQDHEDEAELLRQQAILTGSFWNPEGARKMLESVDVKATENIEEAIERDPEEMHNIAKFVQEQTKHIIPKKRLIRD